MATESSPDPARFARTGTDADYEWLRRRLRLCLEQHLRTDAYRPALAVVGLRSNESTVLRRGAERPEDAVLGFILPDRFTAIGVLASSVVAMPPRRNHQDAALAIGVSRAGTIISLLATPSGIGETTRPQGWLLDGCQRAVRLATAPCSVAPLALPIALWLDRLMVAILNAPTARPLGWADAVNLCPIPQRWRSINPIDLGTTLGSTTRSWRSLRAAAAHGDHSLTGVRAEHAQWMDDAMFARWSLGSFPDLASLRGDVEFLAPATIAEHVELALRAAWLAFAG